MPWRSARGRWRRATGRAGFGHRNDRPARQREARAAPRQSSPPRRARRPRIDLRRGRARTGARSRHGPRWWRIPLRRPRTERACGEIRGRPGSPCLTYRRHGPGASWRLAPGLALRSRGACGRPACDHSCSNRRHSRDIRCGPGHAVPRAFTGSPDHIRGAGFTKPADPRCLPLEQLLSRAGDQLPGRPSPEGDPLRHRARPPDRQQRGTALRGDRPAVDAGDPGSGKCCSRMQRRIGSATRVSTVAAAVGDRGLGVADRANAIRGLILRPAPDATCAENETDEPACLLALRISEKITAPLTVRDSVATFGTHRIPVEQGQMLINFSRGSSPSCSYVDAFNSACPQPDLITDHIVVVGTKLIDAGDIYGQAVSFPHDASFCPVHRPRCMLDSQNYGYRIEGDAIGTVLRDRYLRTQPPVSTQLAVLLLAAIVGLIVYLLSFRVGMLLTASLLLAYYLGIYLIGQNGYLADPLYAPTAIVLAATFSLGARYVLEERERRKVERIFGHYIDPRVARQLAATRSVEDLISKGERRDLTVLFMDIRGFTSMSESMRADDVLAVIQDYLDEMSKLILKWDGLIDKYVGDEIMALWNVPLEQANHGCSRFAAHT